MRADRRRPAWAQAPDRPLAPNVGSPAPAGPTPGPEEAAEDAAYKSGWDTAAAGQRGTPPGRGGPGGVEAMLAWYQGWRGGRLHRAATRSEAEAVADHRQPQLAPGAYPSGTNPPPPRAVPCPDCWEPDQTLLECHCPDSDDEQEGPDLLSPDAVRAVIFPVGAATRQRRP